MTVRTYRSTDSSAPAMSGQAGKLTDLLDAILVNGYGSQVAAGWAIEFTGTNKRAYRAPSGNRFRLRVDDTGTTGARVVGYESMSDVDTGTGAFPTNLQVSGGLHLAKSTTADATARPWTCFASTTAFSIFIHAGQTVYGIVANTDGPLHFGDFDSRLSGDQYNSIIIAGTGTSNAGRISTTTSLSGGTFEQASGHYVPRAYTQIGSAMNVTKTGRSWLLAGGTPMGGNNSPNITYPDPIAGGLLMSKCDVWEKTATNLYARRGSLKGIWIPNHPLPASHGDTFSGTGSLTGRTFELVDAFDSATRGRVILETSDNW